VSNTICMQPFFNLSKDDQLLVLKWRNDDKIRKWMYNKDIIEEIDHIDFINNLKYNKDKKYFLVILKDKKIGVIYFTDIDYEFGIYSNPNFKGNGKVLMKTILYYTFEVLKLKKLKAEVFSINERALSLYLKFGFKNIGMKNVNSQDIICMELINEDR
jgi:UDP-4-amino-4,6-dideoxy-N-acetyl-beta-L-altrosamine N-acetyltransferase